MCKCLKTAKEHLAVVVGLPKETQHLIQCEVFDIIVHNNQIPMGFIFVKS